MPSTRGFSTVPHHPRSITHFPAFAVLRETAGGAIVRAPREVRIDRRDVAEHPCTLELSSGGLASYRRGVVIL